MTRYMPTTDQAFGQMIRDLRARVTTLEQRTNPLGTNADGSVTMSNLYVINGTGSVAITPDTTLPTLVNNSPSVIISDGLGTSAISPQLYSREVDTGLGYSAEEFIVRGAQSSADSEQSAALIFLDAGGAGTNAAHGALVWEQNPAPDPSAGAQTFNLRWDQWGVALEQPVTGSAAANSTVVGSAWQNDQTPSAASSPKFLRAGSFSGTTDGAGNLAVSGLSLGFTPVGVVVTRDQTAAGAGPFCAAWYNVSASGFTTHWVNGTAAYTGSAVAGSYMVFG